MSLGDVLKSTARVLLLLGIASCVSSSFAEYNVRRPSNQIKPRWSGAKAGEWTMDYAAVREQARVTGQCTLMLVTGSWWCPHCEALEEKVLLSDAWKNMIAEKGYFLEMLDFPYRGTVKDEELNKSKYPELGPGWGFQCWLYDDAYLAENGLSAEDGFREIMKRYEIQRELAPATANQVTIRTWDGTSDFTYGKVGYPTIIVFLPDGTEAGRFAPFVTYMEPEEARTYVLEQIDDIVATALNSQCGLCADPERGGLTGQSSQQYEGWLKNSSGYLAGIISVKVSKKSPQGVMKLKARVALSGKKIELTGKVMDGYQLVTLTSSRYKNSKAVLRFGDEGLSGICTHEDVVYEVVGARNDFLARDSESIVRTSTYTRGTWGFVLKPEGTRDTALMSRGYGTLSITLKARGKVTIRGFLGDGTKVSVTRQIIPGDDGVFCLPLVVDLYKKGQGGFGCCIWFKNGWLFNVTDVSPWRNVASVATPAFSVGWRPIYSAMPGFGTIAPEMELVFNTIPTEIDGLPIVVDPDFDAITVRGQKWYGTDVTRFQVKCSASTGVLSGIMKFFAQRESGTVKAYKVRVAGVMVGDAGYCNLVVSRKGSWAAKVSACAACDE